MNLRDLEYFIAVADYQHFRKAAESCHVSQPALSMQIKKLEDQLGVTLLERTSKSVLLTDIGRIIAERARAMLNQAREIREIAKSATDPQSGDLTIGVFPTLSPYLLPIIIPPISKAFPKLSLHLIEEKTDTLIKLLDTGKLDAAILSYPVEHLNFASRLLFEEAFLLAIPINHKLSTNKSITPSQLSHENLLLLDEGHCLRDQALSYCQKTRVRENQNFRATSLETLRQMVAAQVCITLVPKLACTPNKNILYLPLSSPAPSRKIAIFWRDTSSKNEVLNDISDKIKLILAKLTSVKTL